MGCEVSKFCCGSEPSGSNHGVTSSGKALIKLIDMTASSIVVVVNSGFDFCSQVLMIG